MRTPTRHPRLTAIASRLYGVMMWLYPAALRRTCGREMVVTFRTQVEDALNSGSLLTCLTFAAHLALDPLRAHRDQLTAGAAQASPAAVSLLGLADGTAAHGCLAPPLASLQSFFEASFAVIFAAAGFILIIAGWYAFFIVLPTYVC